MNKEEKILYYLSEIFNNTDYLYLIRFIKPNLYEIEIDYITEFIGDYKQCKLYLMGMLRGVMYSKRKRFEHYDFT